MAKDISLKIKIDAANSAQTLSDLTKSMKALVEEQEKVTRGTKEWDVLAEAINETEGRIGELQDSFQTLKGSGIDRLNASTSLMREGFENFDTGKIKLGFQGIAGAMSAIPIFFLVEGLKLLIENWEELVGWFKEFFNLLPEGEKNIRKMTEALADQKRELELLNVAYDNQIKILEAQGGKEKEILALKKEQSALRVKELEDTVALNKAKLVEALSNDSITQSLLKKQAAVLRGIGQDKAAAAIEQAIQKEKLKDNQELIDLIQKGVADISTERTNMRVAEINHDNAVTAKMKANAEKKKAELNKEFEALWNALSVEQDVNDAQTKFREEERQKKIDQEVKWADYDKKIKAEYAKENAEAVKKIEDEYAAKKKASDDAIRQAQIVGLNAAQGLSQAFFQSQLNQAEGNEKKQLQIKKRMFEVDKAFNAARAVQDGIRAVQAALTIPPPGGQILAVINGAMAAANVAKILATRFDAGTQADVSVPSVTATGGGSTTIPQINNASNTTVTPETTFDETGRRNVPMKAYVVGKEIDDDQHKRMKSNTLREY